MVAGEAVARVRAHGRAVAADTWNHADRFERVEIEDRQPFFERPAPPASSSVASCACVAPRGMYSRRPAVSA